MMLFQTLQLGVFWEQGRDQMVPVELMPSARGAKVKAKLNLAPGQCFSAITPAATAKGETNAAPASGCGTAAEDVRRATGGGTSGSADYGRPSYAKRLRSLGRMRTHTKVKKGRIQEQVFKMIKRVQPICVLRYHLLETNALNHRSRQEQRQGQGRRRCCCCRLSNLL